MIDFYLDWTLQHLWEKVSNKHPDLQCLSFEWKHFKCGIAVPCITCTTLYIGPVVNKLFLNNWVQKIDSGNLTIQND